MIGSYSRFWSGIIPDEAKAAIAGVIGPDVSAIATIFVPRPKQRTRRRRRSLSFSGPVANPVAAKLAISFELTGNPTIDRRSIAAGSASAFHKRRPT